MKDAHSPLPSQLPLRRSLPLSSLTRTRGCATDVAVAPPAQSDLVMGQKLGTGGFGVVYKATVDTDEYPGIERGAEVVVKKALEYGVVGVHSLVAEAGRGGRREAGVTARIPVSVTLKQR